MEDDSSEVMLNRLLSACKAWDLEEVKNVVESGFNVDTADDDRITALQIAAANGNIAIVEYLLDMGANIEKDNQIGMTPLLHAAKNGHYNVVRSLLQRGAAIDKLTYYGASALTLAASGGHTDVVQFLINLKLNVNPQDERDTALCPTPMMAAVFKRHTHICVLLSQNGANLHDTITRLDNLSAMSIAITCDARVMVGTLLELKANLTVRSLGNRTPFELARHLKRDEIFAFLENARYLAKGNKAFIRLFVLLVFLCIMACLIARNNRDEANLRRAMRCQMTQTYPENCTLLMYAVVLADVFIVKLLVEETNEINAAEEVLGLTALMFASIIGNSEMVEYLLASGADISQVSKDQFNALDYAFCLGNVKQYLIAGNKELPVKSDFHFSGSRGGMAKLFQKIKFGNSIGFGTESKEKLQPRREHVEKLLSLCGNESCGAFKTANEVLLSNVCGKNSDTPDVYHKKLQKIRSLAEHCTAFGLAPLPVSFIANCSNEQSHVENFAVPVIRTHSNEFLKERPCFSLAQRNIQLFNEICYEKVDEQKLRSNDARIRRVFEQNDRRKCSAFSSIGSEGRTFRRSSRSYSVLQHASASPLGTAHNMRCSREKISSNAAEDGRTSPSRRSLDQYTFTLKAKKSALRKSTSTSALDRDLGKNRSSFTMMNSLPVSSLAAATTTSSTYKETNLLENLKTADLGQYVELFKQNEIDNDALLLMTEFDLEVLISDTLDRKKLKKFVEKIRRHQKQ
uniref:NAD(+) ADP-ribosyltransferase n=1 Tax=Syphacia muris TaxID=451379 RepID=A0A0N5AAZ3_9BILA